MRRFSKNKIIASGLIISQIFNFVIPINTNHALAITTKATIIEQLEGKSSAEKAQIKAHAIAALETIAKTTDGIYGETIAISSVKEIQGGVEVFAQAWDKNKKQLGFLDGTVDIERFRIFNPPILAWDGTWDDYEWVDKVTGEKYPSKKPHFIEDPELALIQTLAHTISIAGKPSSRIVKGRVGNTTDTYYPDAHTESTSCDGYATQLYGAGSGVSWSTLVSDAGSNGRANEPEDTAAGFRTDTGTNIWRGIERSYFLFDTSSLGDTDTIATATISIYGATKADNIGMGSAFDVNIYSSAPAANTDIVAGDFDSVGTVAYSTAITYPNFSNTGYNDFILNASGTAAISKTGISKFGMREATHDAGSSAPTWVSGGNKLTFLNVLMSDTGGTTSDPKLVIVHSTPAGGGGPISVNTIQSLSYTYDANGNITQIVDASQTNTAKTTNFTYDDLNRLITASTTNASSGVNYFHRYNYDAIGNITSSTPSGIYVYGSSTYANPHAATAVSSTLYSYDNNGNLTSDGTWTHSWDYRNRLTQSTKTGATSTYAYDHTNTRVKLTTQSTTTIIASPNYSLEAGIPVKYISGAGQLLATIRGSGSSSTLYAIHADHLGSQDKTTNASGSIVELSDYYPFGSLRTNTQYGVDDRKGYIGKDYDTDTGLSQLEARYYASAVGRFMSQDPVFWEVGMTRDGKVALSNPQALNSYSYGGNNSIVNKDPNGRFWWVGFYDWTGYDGWKGVGMKTLEVFGGHNRAINAINQYQGAVNQSASRYNVDQNLANAIIYEEQSHLLNLPGLPFESVKDYAAPNSQLGGYDGGVGVMQVTGAVGEEYGYTKKELARNPKKNIDAGVGNLSRVQSNSPSMTASRYNYSNAQSPTSYGQRVGAQVSNPNYNTSVIIYGLQQLISSLQGLINSLRR